VLLEQRGQLQPPQEVADQRGGADLKGFQGRLLPRRGHGCLRGASGRVVCCGSGAGNGNGGGAAINPGRAAPPSPPSPARILSPARGLAAKGSRRSLRRFREQDRR
jgi:hypothetical protein